MNKQRLLDFRPAPLLNTIIYPLVFLCALLKAPYFISNSQLYAEDAIIFFRDNYVLGPSAIWHPYAGYYLLGPRLIAWAGNLVPLQAIPLFYDVCAALTLVWVTALLMQRNVELDRKPLLALAMVLAPNSNEIFNNITNIQWFLALGALFILLSSRPPETILGSASEFLFIIVFSLTGPFCLLIAPLFLAKCVLSMKKYASLNIYSDLKHQILLTSIILLGAAIQASALTNRPLVPPADGPALSVFSVFAFRVITSTFREGIARPIGLVDACALFGVFFLISFGATRNRVQFIKFSKILIFAFILLLSVYITFRPNIQLLYDIGNGQRYFYIPKVIVLWLLILSAPTTWIATLALAVVAYSAPYIKPSPGPSSWPDTVLRMKRGEAVDAPINIGRGVQWRLILPERPPAERPPAERPPAEKP